MTAVQIGRSSAGPGQESGNIFSGEGLILMFLAVIVLIAGGMIYAHFFGPHA